MNERVIVLGSVLLLATIPGGAGRAGTDDTARLERGHKVYQAQRCRTCHSIDGAGNRRSPLDGVGSRLDEEKIRKWIVSPREMDPKVKKRAYDKLPPEDLAALVAYLLSLEAKE